MEQATRNQLRKAVAECRALLEADVAEQLEGRYGIRRDGRIDEIHSLKHLDPDERQAATDLRAFVAHLQSTQTPPLSPRDAIERATREIAFTYLNRFVALRLMEERGVIQQSLAKGRDSSGFKLFARVAPGALSLAPDGGYRRYLEALFDEIGTEVGVLFDRNLPASRVFAEPKTVDAILRILGREELNGIWTEDETIGWVYQYFTPKEDRKRLHDPKQGGSSAPRNSYELAVRNQFYTPQYVVQFLVDNTHGRIWYEMRKGETRLKDTCHYLVRRPNEIFLKMGERPPESSGTARDVSQEDLLRRPIHVPHRPKKDPRDLRILDPACGSGHFLLYAFDLLETIYEEAWADEESPTSEITGRSLRDDYPDMEKLRRDVPELILRHNLYGIDIDLRACQIAALALWLRAQRTYQLLGLKGNGGTAIRKTNIVCAEPMPGETELLREFSGPLNPPLLGQLMEAAVKEMKVAGEAGSLLRIEAEIRDAIFRAKKQWHAGTKREQMELFPEARRPKAEQLGLFDVSGITDEQFWVEAEGRILERLEAYAQQAGNGRSFRRQLFADDAEEGFAFVDLCRKRFDVVLMNPPFGAASQASKPYIDLAYPRTKNDLYAAFVERGLEWLDPGGLLGTITSRTGFFQSSFQKWREEILLRETRPTVVADLGPGVLDTAMVETAAYCLEKAG